MKEFEKFISSPFFNKGRNYVPFFRQLKRFYPGFDNEKMTPEYIYAKMYPGKKFNKQILWNMTSRMLAMAEDFLMHVSLRKNKFVREQQIAEEFLERKLSDYQNKKVSDMEAALEKTGFGSYYFRNEAQLANARIANLYLEDTQHLIYKHLINKGEYVIMNFMKEISDIIAAMEASSNMYSNELETNLPFKFVKGLQLEKVIDYAYSNNFKYAPIFEMYYLSIMIVLEFEKPEYFFKLKKLFEENYNSFAQEEKYEWIIGLTNYCVEKINTGNHEFRKTIFELDKFKLREGIVFPSRFMSKTLYLQILGNALAVKETQWAKEYIEKYIPRLKPSYQKPMQALSYACMNYLVKDYDKVLEYLGKVKFVDAIDKVYVKSIYIRTFYDLGEFEIFLNQIDSMKHFLNKNKMLGDYFKRTYSKTLNYLTKLLQVREKNDYIEAEMLENTIKGEKQIQMSEWMLEKIAEIRKGAK